ncbi:MAG: M50 family metallopeptidase [Pirellulales bacterium]
MLRPFLFVLTALAASWLGMTALHELGHVLNAWLSGGRVTHVELPPRGLGHTEVSRNPSPRFVAWGGALWGSFLGAAPMLLVRRGELALWFARFFAGACLIANGVYLAVGCFIGDPNGADDAHELLRHGAAAWQLVAFGVLTVAAGLTLWHRLGPRAGFMNASSLAGWKTVSAFAAFTAALLAVGWLLPIA